MHAEFAKHETLMMLLREDAWAGLTMAVRTMQLGTLAGAYLQACVFEHLLPGKKMIMWCLHAASVDTALPCKWEGYIFRLW